MKKATNWSKLKRKRYAMPGYIRKALIESQTLELYKSRPAYQQNDYVGWITRAVRPETSQKRLRQMVEELKDGELYMKMKWKQLK